MGYVYFFLHRTVTPFILSPHARGFGAYGVADASGYMRESNTLELHLAGPVAHLYREDARR